MSQSALPTFRPALPTDLEFLVALEQRSNPSPWSESHLQQSLEAGHRVLVCCLDEILAGYCVSTTVLDEVSLLNICIDTQHQGRGLAFALLQYLIQREAEAGATSMWLEVRKSNRRARRLYEWLGFSLQGVRKAYYPTLEGREDALVYSLSPLSSAV